MDLRGDARLVEEHVGEAPLLGEVRVDHLHRDPSLEAVGSFELREIDRRHPTLGDAIAQPVAPEPTTLEGRRSDLIFGGHHPSTRVLPKAA